MGDTVVRLTQIQGGITNWLIACTSRINLIEGYLNRIVKQDYIKTQTNRFESENVGPDFDGGKWESLDQKYAEYKRKKYASFPGGGNKVNVRQSNLLQSLLLQDSYYPAPEPKKIRAGKKGSPSKGEQTAGSLAVVNATSIHIYTMVPYASFVDEERTFTKWSQYFWDRTNRGIMDYLSGKGKG